MLLLFVFQNVEAQQQDYDKLIAKTLNEKNIYENERDSISILLRNKIGFFKQNDIDKEFREKWFSEKDVNAWRDSIKQATNTLHKYSKEYIYDLKDKYEKYPTRVFDEEIEREELEKQVWDLEKTFKSRTEKIRSEKYRIDNEKHISDFLQNYAVVGETFRADGTETYLTKIGPIEKALPAGDYIITNKEKIVKDGVKERWTIELKSKKKNKKYSVVTKAEYYRDVPKGRKEWLNNLSSKFVDFQKRVQELEEQLDYSKSPEKQQVEENRKKVKELDIKIDSLRNIPNPYQKEYEGIIDLAKTLEKGKFALKVGASLKQSQYHDLRKQQNKAETTEYNRQREQRKNNFIAKYGKETGTNIYNKKYWIGMKEEYLKAGDYSVTLVHSDGNTRVYRYMDIGFAYNDMVFIYKYAIFKNGTLTSLVDNFTVKN